MVKGLLYIQMEMNIKGIFMKVKSKDMADSLIVLINHYMKESLKMINFTEKENLLFQREIILLEYLLMELLIHK